MSPKKVRKHIRRMQRERRRTEREAVREERRQARQEEATRRRAEAQETADRKAAEEKAAEEKAAEEKAAAGREDEATDPPSETEEPEREPATGTQADPEPAPDPEPVSDPGAEPEPEPATAPEAQTTGDREAESEKTTDRTTEHTTEKAPEDAPKETPDAQPEERPRAPLIAGGVRAGAVVAAVGVLAVAGGSLAMDVSGSTAQPRTVAPADVPAAVTQASLVCPPMPGLPDSVSTDGMLEYQDRDDSVEASARGLILTPEATDESGVDAELGLLGQDGYDSAEELASSDPDGEDGGDGDDSQTALAEWRHASAELGGETDSPVLRMLSQDDSASLAGAAQYVYTADSGAVTGTAAADCLDPQRSHWFFGPEIGDGASSLLTLANPSDRQATAEVTAYDSDGARSGPGVRTLVVPAQSTRTINMASIAGEDPINGVQVSASQAPVAAHLQSSRASDGTGIGTEFLPSSQTDARQHVIAGVPVAADSEDEAAAFPTELWIRTADSGGSTVEVQVYGDDGPAQLENASVFTVEGGEVDSVDLSGLDAGTYDIVVTTEGPSDVAVKSYGAEPEDQDSIDFAWAAGSALMQEGYGALLPAEEAAEAELRLFAPEAGGEVVYRVLDAEGETSEPLTAEVPTGGAVTLSGDDLAPDDVGDPVAVVFEQPEIDVVGAVMITGEDGTFAMLPVRALDDAGETVPVRLID